MEDFVEAKNTYGDLESFRRSAVIHVRSTRYGKSRLTLRDGTSIFLDLDYYSARNLVWPATNAGGVTRSAGRRTPDGDYIPF